MAEPSEERQDSCLVCGATNLSVFWEMSDLPIHCNVLCATREQALEVPRGDIVLAVCHACGFIRNEAYDSSQVHYDQTYENSLHFSPRFESYARGLARRLIDQYELRDKEIVEIGCGQGQFLEMLCELGDNRGIGLDPGYAGEAAEVTSAARVKFVQTSYSEKCSQYQADLICCRHALEHIPNPVEFMKVVRWNIDPGRSPIVFFEVPNVLYTLRDLGIWDIIYEHCSYFGESALARCFVEAGFAVLSVTEAYDGQFLGIEAQPGGKSLRVVESLSGDPANTVREAEAFANRFAEKLEGWRKRLDAIGAKGGRAVLWGSGSKGVTFLNMLGNHVPVEFVVDINPRKKDMHVAGTGQKIVAPEFLREYRPDHIIVMNGIYVEEIRSTVAKMGLTPEFHLA